MKSQRPVFLNLLQIRFPVTAIASITHRISGFLLFLFIPALLFILHCSLSSAANFNKTAVWFSTIWARLAIFLLLASMIYHLVAGIRHLLMDMHIGDGRCTGKLGAWLAFIISGILIVGLGACLIW